MRPLRSSISKKNSIEKCSDNSVESRLLSSFSKIASKNNERQAGNNSSHISIQIHPSSYYGPQLSKKKQHFSTNSYQSSILASYQNSPKINRISMSREQSIQQKQNIIQHLKIELQQSRYIISSLKQQIKQLSSALIESNKVKNIIECQKCTLMEGTMAQLKYLKQKQSKDNQFLETYQELISKLTQKIEQLNTQNLQLKSKNHITDSQQTLFFSTQTNFITYNHQQPVLKQNKSFFNQFQQKSKQNDTFNKSRCSFQLRLESNQKKNSLKQNHPCTPKNNLPLSLSKNQTSGFKSNSFSTLQQTQNSSQISIQSDQIQKFKQNKSKIGSSPVKIKQKLIGRNNRKSLNFINENIQNQYEGFGIKMTNKLDKKIYF